MRYISKYARTPVTLAGVPVKVPVTAIMWATFWHISSRERDEDETWGLRGGADPQSHAHNLVSKWIRVNGVLYELEEGTVTWLARFSQNDIEAELFRGREKAMLIRAGR